MSALPSPGFSLCCCSIALRDKPVFEALEVLAGAGFAGVELWQGHFSGLDASGLAGLREKCRALGLSVSVLAPYFSFTRGSDRLEESLREAEKILVAGSVLGVKKIRTFVDCGPDGLPSARASAGDWEAAAVGLRRLCRLDPAVEFVVETHDNTLADSVPSIQRLFDAVAMPNLRLNFQANEDFLARGFLASLETLYPLVSHMHWQQVSSDHTHTYLEEPGLIDFRELTAFLRQKNYAGSASVEYCWPGVPPERVATAARFLAAVFTKA
jgi:sugar phosphate isomerase/epimerase